MQCEVKTVSLTFAIYCLSLESELVFVLAPDISSWLGYCFDISLLSMLSIADFGLNTLDFDISSGI